MYIYIYIIYIYICVCVCVSLLFIRKVHCVSSFFLAQNVLHYLEFIMIMNIISWAETSEKGFPQWPGVGHRKRYGDTIVFQCKYRYKHSFGRF